MSESPKFLIGHCFRKLPMVLVVDFGVRFYDKTPVYLPIFVDQSKRGRSTIMITIHSHLELNEQLTCDYPRQNWESTGYFSFIVSSHIPVDPAVRIKFQNVRVYFLQYSRY